jgi:hypothetical protein
METRACMCATISTLGTLKNGIGLSHYSSHSPLLIHSPHFAPLFLNTLNLCSFHLCPHCLDPCLIALGLCLIVPFLGPIAPILCEFLPLSISSTPSRCPNGMSPSSYADLFAIPEFAQCREVFLHAGWGSFLSHLQGHDDGISMQFSLRF